ncbi:MAG: PEP/pyruvate-binding domain-containing protein, partial [Candidatus Omnitrophota bacterium]
EYLNSLGLKVITREGVENVHYAGRIAQLTQRTSQFNLTGKRFTEEQVQALILSDKDYRVYSLQMADKFGDAGIVAVMIVSVSYGSDTIKCGIEGFYLSCRAIGLTIENALMAAVVKYLSEGDIHIVEGWYCRTERNSHVEDLYPRFGFGISGKDRWMILLPGFEMKSPGWIRINEYGSSAGDPSANNDGGEALDDLIAEEYHKLPLASRIERAEVLVREWREIVSLEPITRNDATRLQVISTTIISLTPLESDVNTVDPSLLVSLYQDIAGLSITTYEKLSLLNIFEDARQTRKFQLKAAKFIYVADYALEYSYIINLLDAVNLYCSTVLPKVIVSGEGLRRYALIVKSAVFEALTRIIHFVWGFAYHNWRCRKEFESAKDRLVSLGNTIVPGLYNRLPPSAKVDLIKVEMMSRQRRDVKVGVRQPWTYKIMFFSYLMPLITGSLELLSWIEYALGMTDTFNLQASLTKIILSFVISLIFNWYVLGLTDVFYEKNKKAVEKYKGYLKARQLQDYNRKLLYEEYGKLWDSWKQEKQSVEAGLDAVIIAANDDPSSLRIDPRVLKDRAIPVMLRRSDSIGSGMVFLEIMRAWKDNLTLGEFIDKLGVDYGNTRGGRLNRAKLLKDTRIALIPADKDICESQTDNISWPISAEEMIQLNSVEFAILNCIRAGRAMKADNAAGLVIHNADGVYVGPIHRYNGIVLLAAWANIRQAVNEQLGIIVSDDKRNVLTIYERAHMRTVKKHQSSMYDWCNFDMKQVLANTGIVIISYDGKQSKVMSRLAEFAAGMHKFFVKKISSEGDFPVRIRLVADIITVLARLNQRADLYSDVVSSYFNSRIDALDRDTPSFAKQKGLLRSLGDWYYKRFYEAEGFRLFVRPPSHHEALYFRVSRESQVNQEAFKLISDAAEYVRCHDNPWSCLKDINDAKDGRFDGGEQPDRERDRVGLIAEYNKFIEAVVKYVADMPQKKGNIDILSAGEEDMPYVLAEIKKKLSERGIDAKIVLITNKPESAMLVRRLKDEEKIELSLEKGVISDAKVWDVWKDSVVLTISPAPGGSMISKMAAFAVKSCKPVIFSMLRNNISELSNFSGKGPLKELGGQTYLFNMVSAYTYIKPYEAAQMIKDGKYREVYDFIIAAIKNKHDLKDRNAINQYLGDLKRSLGGHPDMVLLEDELNERFEIAIIASMINKANSRQGDNLRKAANMMLANIKKRAAGEGERSAYLAKIRQQTAPDNWGIVMAVLNNMINQGKYFSDQKYEQKKTARAADYDEVHKGRGDTIQEDVARELYSHLGALLDVYGPVPVSEERARAIHSRILSECLRNASGKDEREAVSRKLAGVILLAKSAFEKNKATAVVKYLRSVSSLDEVKLSRQKQDGGNNGTNYSGNIVDLKKALDTSRFGGKAASLAKLIDLGYNVPQGFAVSYEVFQEFLEETKIRGFIADTLERARREPGNIEAILAVSESLKKEIMARTIPDEIADEVVSNYAALRKRHLCEAAGSSVMVRSSAIGEDGMEAFAGQHDSFANLVSEEEVLTALKGCWASLWNPQAISYRLKKGLDIFNVKMGVVIQEMIPCDDASGIAFSVNPYSRDTFETLIVSSYGSCAGVVSEGAPADEISYDNYSHTINIYRSRKADKTWMAAIGPGGKIQKKALPAQKAQAWSIDEEQQLEIAQTAIMLEHSLGYPVDMEWCLDKGIVMLLQARRITTFSQDKAFPVKWSPLSDRQFAWDLYLMGGESTPYTPMELSRFKYAEEGTRLALINFPMNVRFKELNGFMYKTYKTAPLSLRMLKFLLRAVTQTLFNIFYAGVIRLADGFPYFRRFEDSFKKLSWYYVWDNVLPEVKKDVREMRMMNRSADIVSPVVLAGYVERFNQISVRFWRIHYDAALAFLSMRLGKYFAKDDFIYLTQGVRTVTTDMTDAAWLLSRSARTDPDLCRELKQRTEIARERKTTVDMTGLPEGFIKEHKVFVDAYGRFTTRITNPDWSEDNRELMRWVIELSEKNDDFIEKRKQESIAKRQDKFAGILFQVSPLKRFWVEFKLRMVQKGIQYVEDHHYYIEQSLEAEYRKLLLSIGKRFVRDGLLEQPEDILFLTCPEVLKILSETKKAVTGEAKEQLISRKKTYEEQKKTQPPHTLGKRTAPRAGKPGKGTITMLDVAKNSQAESFIASALPGKCLYGEGVSQGSAEGRAVIVRSMDDFGKVKTGDVIVCEEVTPLWASLFIVAVGVVADSGDNILQHTAITARENGIPAVIKTEIAMQTLRDGQRVRVDGFKGIVEILEESEADGGNSPGIPFSFFCLPGRDKCCADAACCFLKYTADNGKHLYPEINSSLEDVYGDEFQITAGDAFIAQSPRSIQGFDFAFECYEKTFRCAALQLVFAYSDEKGFGVTTRCSIYLRRSATCSDFPFLKPIPRICLYERYLQKKEEKISYFLDTAAVRQENIISIDLPKDGYPAIGGIYFTPKAFAAFERLKRESGFKEIFLLSQRIHGRFFELIPERDPEISIHRNRRDCDGGQDRDFSGWLLVTDYDGTIAFYPDSVPERLQNVLGAFLRNGGRWVIATGQDPLELYYDNLERTGVLKNLRYSGQMHILGELGGFIGYCETRGDLVLSEDASLDLSGEHKKRIEEKLAEKLAELGLLEHLGSGKDSSIQMFFDKRSLVTILVKESRLQEYTEEIVEYLSRELSADGLYLTNHHNFIVVISLCTKGIRLREFAHRWEVPMSRIIVAGDSENDFDMLRLVNEGATAVFLGRKEILPYDLLDKVLFAANPHDLAELLEEKFDLGILNPGRGDQPLFPPVIDAEYSRCFDERETVALARLHSMGEPEQLIFSAIIGDPAALRFILADEFLQDDRLWDEGSVFGKESEMAGFDYLNRFRGFIPSIARFSRYILDS